MKELEDMQSELDQELKKIGLDVFETIDETNWIEKVDSLKELIK